MHFVNAKFDWDLGNIEKCQKHGLTIAEIEAFFSVDLMVFEDIRHFSGEAVSCSWPGARWAACFCWFYDPVSRRRAAYTAGYRSSYEKEGFSRYAKANT